MENLIHKIPAIFRWILALPLALAALSVAQGISTIIAKIFFELNKLQIFNWAPNEVNFFLINLIASWAFLSTFHFVVPKAKLKATVILAGLYVVFSLAILAFIIINKSYGVENPLRKTINESLGIIAGCVGTCFIFKNLRQNA